MRWALLVLGVASGAAVIAALAMQTTTARRGMTGRVPVARATTKADPGDNRENRSKLTCSGGLDYPADIQLIPDAVVTPTGREAVDYHAEINVHRGKAVGLAWQAEAVDDRGKQCHRNESSENR